MMIKNTGNGRTVQKGISLLETILVMVVASIVTLSVLLYYKNAQRNKLIDAGIKLIEQIIAAADNYQTPATIQNINGVPTIVDTGTYDTNDDGSGGKQRHYLTYSGINTNAIAQSGFIPEQYLYETDPGNAQQMGIKSPWFSVSADGAYMGIVTVAFASDADEYGQSGTSVGYQIIFDKIPDYACVTLKDRITALKDTGNVCQNDNAIQLEKVTGCDEDEPNQLTIYSYPADSRYCDNESDNDNA